MNNIKSDVEANDRNGTHICPSIHQTVLFNKVAIHLFCRFLCSKEINAYAKGHFLSRKFNMCDLNRVAISDVSERFDVAHLHGQTLTNPLDQQQNGSQNYKEEQNLNGIQLNPEPFFIACFYLGELCLQMVKLHYSDKCFSLSLHSIHRHFFLKLGNHGRLWKNALNCLIWITVLKSVILASFSSIEVSLTPLWKIKRCEMCVICYWSEVKSGVRSSYILYFIFTLLRFLIHFDERILPHR